MKKVTSKALVILLTVALSHAATAQQKLQFEKLSPMLNEAFGFAFAGSEDKAFALTGGDDAFNFTSVLQTYYTKLDTWTGTKVDNLPFMNFGSATYMPAYNGVIFLGGITPYGSSIRVNKDIRMLNLDDNSITELGELPIAAKNMGLARADNTIYIFGGSVQATPRFVCSDKVFSYDLKSGHLEQLPDMPIPQEASGAIIEGKLFILGGYDQNALTSVYQYDLEEQEWSTLAPLETPLSNYSLVQYEHYLILVGDYVKTNQILVYDTRNDKRHYLKMNLNGRYLGAAVVDEHLYIYGGVVPSPNYYIKNETYRIALQDILAAIK